MEVIGAEIYVLATGKLPFCYLNNLQNSEKAMTKSGRMKLMHTLQTDKKFCKTEFLVLSAMWEPCQPRSKPISSSKINMMG